MQIISKQGDPDLAEVYVARFRGDDRYMAEFVDARDPDHDPTYKWVIIVSTQFGCPISCPMCDAGGDYEGDLTGDEIFAQIDHVVDSHGTGRLAAVEKFKVQFARMGEPALNPAVLDVLCELPSRYRAQGLIPCIATTAPANACRWFERLIGIRQTKYAGSDVQLQISLNSTDDAARDRLMPYPKMSFETIGKFIDRFHVGGTRKVSLNFALTKDVPVEPDVIARHFDPESTCIKITPLNPTSRSQDTGMDTALPPHAPEECDQLCQALGDRGFDVILSIGDVRENDIGSNCGMAVRRIRAK
jgi:23S rRNA (adenine2503-C2)-methyltransferase